MIVCNESKEALNVLVKTRPLSLLFKPATAVHDRRCFLVEDLDTSHLSLT